MQAVEATDVLSQRASSGNGHREEERVKPLIVEAFAKISSRGDDEPFLIVSHSKDRL